jgi:uncharacterized protein
MTLRNFAAMSALLLALVFILTGCFTGSQESSSVTPEAASTAEIDPGGGPVDVTLSPLSIAALRQRVYPGSDFVIEQTLDPGSNYNQYVVSYLSDGLKIYALMTVPQAPKPPTGYPVIIFNHGYIPPTLYRTTERYVAYVDAFARSGYIVIKSDYRGHGDSQGAAESVYGSPGYTIDVLNALASARRYPDADPNRIGMWGHSMGGYITLRAMVANQGIKAGVIWSGVVASYPEMFRSWFGDNSYMREDNWLSRMVHQHGSEDENPAFWNSLSANSYLADLSGPIQLHHAMGDETVPVSYSVMLAEQIRAAGKHVELFLYPGDDHNISENRDNALLLSVVFFNQYVKGSYG